VYHSPRRLAMIVCKLAERKITIPGIEHSLTQITEISFDNLAVAEALSALLATSRMSVDCLERLLSMDEWRTETLASLCTDVDNSEAIALETYLRISEQLISHADAVYTVMARYCTYAPDVKKLARLFAQHACFDEQIVGEVVMAALMSVPLGPTCDIASPRVDRMSFAVFAEYVYGTQHIPGYWSSMMEDVCAILAEAVQNGAQKLPRIEELISSYNQFSETGLSVDALVEFILPSFGFPGVDECEAVYEAYAIVRGGDPLKFRPFVQWIADLAVEVPPECFPQDEVCLKEHVDENSVAVAVADVACGGA